MTVNSGKIPCILLVYHDFTIIKKCIDALLQYQDKLDLIVVENMSDFTTTQIFPYIIALVKSGQISKYILFDKNITNNALEVVFDCVDLELKNEYVLVSDGDLVPETPDWLEEQINILNAHPDVFTCGVSLDLRNLPIRTMPKAKSWIDSGIDCGDYILSGTGVSLLLFRTHEFINFLKYRRMHPTLKFRDRVMRGYCKNILGMKWARTKKSLAYHLTWDNYTDPNNPYVRLKLQQSHEQIWTHFRYCRYKIFTKSTTSSHFPIQKLVASPFYKSLYLLKRIATKLEKSVVGRSK